MITMILKAYNNYYRTKLLLDIPNVILKKNQNRLIVLYTCRYKALNKNVFFHTYVLEKYCKDTLTKSYLFSVHLHKHHANLWKHENLGPKMVGAN